MLRKTNKVINNRNRDERQETKMLRGGHGLRRRRLNKRRDQRARERSRQGKQMPRARRGASECVWSIGVTER